MRERIKYHQESDILLVEILLEKLDLFETPHVLSDVENAIKSTATAAVVVDLKAVETIDSSGIGFLIAIRNRLLKEKVPLLVVCASPSVMQVFRLTKIQQLIPVFATKDEAVASLSR